MSVFATYEALFKKLRNPQRLLAALETVFDVSAGHDHDGTNSKLVEAGAPAAGALSADETGRAMMADDYFDAATVLAKFDADSFDNAQLILAIKDGAFNADAATRALFDDGIWPLAKLAATAKYHILNYQVEDLGEGADITGRCIFAAPAGIDVTVKKVYIIPQGNAAGIDDSNTCLINLADGTNTLVEKEYDTDPAFPAAAAVTDLGTVHAVHGILSAGEKLYLTVTNGATANPPAFMLQVVYSVADAA